jgi:hypothetical protein
MDYIRKTMTENSKQWWLAETRKYRDLLKKVNNAFRVYIWEAPR